MRGGRGAGGGGSHAGDSSLVLVTSHVIYVSPSSEWYPRALDRNACMGRLVSIQTSTIPSGVAFPSKLVLWRKASALDYSNVGGFLYRCLMMGFCDGSGYETTDTHENGDQPKLQHTNNVTHRTVQLILCPVRPK